MSYSTALAESLNQNCACMGTDISAVRQQLDWQLSQEGLAHPLTEIHAHLISGLPVFVAHEHERQMRAVIGAVERVTALPAYREEVLANSPVIARSAPPARGVFFGFDFHIAADGPKLIEINSNAGGAFVNLEMLRSQQACCAPVAGHLSVTPSPELLENSIVEMFREEWRRARGARSLATVAIVDDDPRGQYLYPEFLLARNLFEKHGIRAIIADARELEIRRDSLRHEGAPIDLVYNRSTDFYLSDVAHAALLEAHARDVAVVTPHPHAHALYSSKRNLVYLSDRASLRGFGATESDVEILIGAVPRTLLVVEPLQPWWDERKQWFFKPTHGFGSRGTYRGDKITRRAFGEVVRGNYIAQRISPASERRHAASGDPAGLKFDVRSYAYAGRQQMLGARLYQGQTTNFRTAGGGFAPVYLVDEAGLHPIASDCRTRCDPAPS